MGATAPTKLGIQVPDGYRDRDELELVYVAPTGMEYELYAPEDDGTVVMGASHEDVGLVTWFRFQSDADARAWVAEREHDAAD